MKKALLILLIFCNIILNGQISFNYTKHLEQYWNYRYALLGDAIDPDFYSWESGIFETIINIKYATQ